MTRTRSATLAAFTALALCLPAASLFGETKSSQLTIISTTDVIGELSPCG